MRLKADKDCSMGKRSRLIRRTYQQLARKFHENLDHTRANEFDSRRIRDEKNIITL